MEEIKISFVINGEKTSVYAPPSLTLLKLLRERLGLTGAKPGCERGECGACTVLLDGEPVNSCLVLVGQVEGREIVTIEGLADGDELDPIQEAFIAEGAVQCGYCTPGMIISARALLNRNDHPGREEIKRAISGNLCRCTGYVKIIKAIETAAEKIRR